ncbi:MAG TPA: NAD(P)H-hydrate dehydratase [Puia sp.]|nr:NAD(P)H-hydrate dehydratase [Puia sp.]
MNDVHAYLKDFSGRYAVTDLESARSLYRPRDPFSNKGSFGHVLLLAGSFGKMGAALMAARACLRTGAGLLTTHIPGCGYTIMQTAVPEAMVTVDPDDEQLTTIPDYLKPYHVAAVGPGIGTSDETKGMLKKLLKNFAAAPLVLDADALNIMSREKKLLEKIPLHSVLTPHPKEFDRLFGTSTTDHRRFKLARKQAMKHKLVIVLKGHFTGVFAPDGNIYFNTSGNAGMAKGGSGDVLTGMVTALLAQSYSPVDAARLAVFLHGLAGDIAANGWSQEAMLPTDLIECIGKAFSMLSNASNEHPAG